MHFSKTTKTCGIQVNSSRSKKKFGICVTIGRVGLVIFCKQIDASSAQILIILTLVNGTDEGNDQISAGFLKISVILTLMAFDIHGSSEKISDF